MLEGFKKQLAEKSVSSGGNFVRTDFHVHYPGLDDYEYKGDDSVQVMGKALNDEGIGLAVVLRHQEFPTKEQLQSLQKFCKNTVLLPGAEINVFVDALDKKVSKDHYFHCIVVADPKSDWAYLLHKAKDKFTYKGENYPSGFHSSIEDLGKFFIGEGALFIAAHLHQAKAPEKSRSVDDIYEDDAFLDFVESGVFTALEVRSTATAEFFDGRRTTKSGKQIPKAICVRSSDAHSHEHLIERQRSTWVQMETPSFEELKASLSFRHRVRLEAPDFKHSQVIGLHVEGSFIKESWIEFSPGINCLIGCKGSGKTSVLECLRFVLNTDVPSERQETVDKHLNHILGPAGYVECLVKKSDGTQHLLTRKMESKDRIKITEQDGTAREVQIREGIDFDVSILGWHEIEAVADRPSARIKLLDRIQGEDEIKLLYSTIESNIENARDLLPTFQRKIKRLDESLKSLWGLQRKRRTLQKLEEGELLQLQNKYEQYLSIQEELKSLKTQLIRAGNRTKKQVDSAFRFLQNDPTEVAAMPADITEPINRSSECRKHLKSEIDGISDKISTLSQDSSDIIQTQIDEVIKAFAKFRENEYEPRTNELPTEEREILSRQILIIEETKGLPEEEDIARALRDEVQALALELHDFCDNICKSRKKICDIRIANIAQINTEVDSIEMSFLRSANHARRDSFMNTYREEASGIMGLVNEYGGAEPYEKLRSLFADFRDLKIEEERWAVKDLMWDAKFVEFLKIFDDDDVEIRMQVGAAGFVPIQNLSAGQRCTAVFPLLLRNTKGPLVIDQPEDNLDNRYIADTIAPDLLKKKNGQQFVTTSHNANLVVLTDSDLIVHADSDGKSGQIVERGFFGCQSSRIAPSVLDVLDGGEQALRARQQKYGNSD
ncbi:AAA family ATPase [Bremerella alba]|uniref:Rad50/SbcC-type AAA domain-containing protein n=1 Tax=Bremerella alba TaxID=980252 RepID=A0A7V8V8T0_9BACT|nr:AAA family ATPase [Bremerella alba]MBA2117074.1 hypothetical protein [Bremerella alba]